jgi:hypothetical protein
MNMKHRRAHLFLQMDRPRSLQTKCLMVLPWPAFKLYKRKNAYAKIRIFIQIPFLRYESIKTNNMIFKELPFSRIISRIK